MGAGTRAHKSCDHIKGTGLREEPRKPSEGFQAGVTEIGPVPYEDQRNYSGENEERRTRVGTGHGEAVLGEITEASACRAGAEEKWKTREMLRMLNWQDSEMG